MNPLHMAFLDGILAVILALITVCQKVVGWVGRMVKK